MKVDVHPFQGDVEKYIAYLQTTEGRLRLDLAWMNLRNFLPRAVGTSFLSETSQALDLGGGTGATALCLAELGFHVTLMDKAEAMLSLAAEAARGAGVSDRLTFQQADAADLPSLFPNSFFDVVVCHNMLEYAEDPAAVLRGIRQVSKCSAGAVVSIVVRNRAGEVLKAGIKAGDLALAEKNLTAEWACESLYGGRVRLFRPAELRDQLHQASLEIIAERGVRVMADYLPRELSQDAAAYERLLAFEQSLGEQPDLAAIARYTQVLARAAGPDRQG